MIGFYEIRKTRLKKQKKQRRRSSFRFEKRVHHAGNLPDLGL
jgi:hypothetical protein